MLPLLNSSNGHLARLARVAAHAVCALALSALPISAVVAQAPATLPADAGILNQMQGQVVLAEPGKGVVSAVPFMKLRHGDTLRLPAGARAGVIYFANGRQEVWKGPAEVRIESAQGTGHPATPEVSQIAVEVAQRLERTALLARIVREGRPGSVSVRSITANAEIRAARERYDVLRSNAAADDLTPDMYLLTVLESHRRFDEMKALLQAMRARRPDDPLISDMAAWLEKQAQ